MQSTVPIEEWDESRVLAALDRLQNMHIQLRHLRETIPYLIQPLHASHSSPTALYQAIAQSATTAVKNVQNFQAIMRESKSKDVLQRAKDSQAQNPEGIQTWMVTEHADWLERRAEDDVKELRIREKSVGEDQMRVEEIRTAVEKFNASRGSVLATVEGEKAIQIKIPTPSSPLEFAVTPYSEPQNGARFAITCKQTSKLHISMLSAITSNANGKDLAYILDLLASYSDLGSRPCVKCRRLLDSQGQFPVIRTPSDVKAENQEQRQWNVLHVGCL